MKSFRNFVLSTVLLLGLFVQMADARGGVVLVFSGGGLRTLAQLSVVKVLLENKIPIVGIVGASTGSIMGGLLAIGYSPDEIEKIVADTDLPGIIAEHTGQLYIPNTSTQVAGGRSYLLKITKTGNQGGPLGFFAAMKLFEKLTTLATDVKTIDFMKLPIPFAAVATDINTSEKVVLKDGSIAAAMRASMAMPGIFEPWKIGDRLLVDGGIVSNLPVLTAKELFPGFPVVAIDVSADPKAGGDVQNIVDVIDRAITILNHRNVVEERGLSDILIQPEVHNFGLFDQEQSSQIIAEGRRAAESKIAEIIKLVDGSPAPARRTHLPREPDPVVSGVPPMPDWEFGVSGYTTNIDPYRWVILNAVKRDIISGRDSLAFEGFLGEEWRFRTAYRTASAPSNFWEVRANIEKWKLSPVNSSLKNWTRYGAGASHYFNLGDLELGLGYACEYVNTQEDRNSHSSGPILNVAYNTLNSKSDPSAGGALHLSAWWANFDELLFRLNFFKPFRLTDKLRANFRIGFAEGNFRREGHAIYLGAAEELYSIAGNPIEGKRAAWANVAFRQRLGKSVLGTMWGEVFAGMAYIWDNDNELIAKPWEAGLALSVPNNLIDAKIAVFYTSDKTFRFAFFLGAPSWGHYPLP